MSAWTARVPRWNSSVPLFPLEAEPRGRSRLGLHPRGRHAPAARRPQRAQQKARDGRISEALAQILKRRTFTLIAPSAANFEGVLLDFDILVIGGGVAGTDAAKTAANLGAKVALAEVDKLGGT